MQDLQGDDLHSSTPAKGRRAAVSQRLNQWTPARRARFLDRLSARGNVAAAAASCGLSRQSVYKLRRRDPQFARQWDAALARLRENLEQELMRRIAANPRLAAAWASLPSRRGEAGAPPAGEGAGTALLDTVKCINPVSTTPPRAQAQRTQSSPISS